MPKRQNNDIRNNAENAVTHLAQCRFLDGGRGLPASRNNSSTVSLSKISEMTGVSLNHLNIIRGHVNKLVDIYGLEPSLPRIQGNFRKPLTGIEAANKVRTYFGRRSLPARIRIAKLVGLSVAELDTTECHDMITRLYKENGREWGIRDAEKEQRVLEAYEARLKEEKRMVPRLPDNGKIDLQRVAIETSLSPGRLRSKDIKKAIEDLDRILIETTICDVDQEINKLREFVDRQIAAGICVQIGKHGFKLAKVAYDVGIPIQRLRNVEGMRVIIGKWFLYV